MTAAEPTRQSRVMALVAIPDFPLVEAGDDLAGLVIQGTVDAGIALESGDILVIAQKVVSKAEARAVSLSTVVPGQRALELSSESGKDARLVQLILDEADSVSRVRPGLIITTHRLGFTSANSGIDQSNVAQGGSEVVLLLPEDPDLSARKVRDRIATDLNITVGVIVTDSHGRPFRLGTVGVAIGVAGLPALWDRRGEADLFGYELRHTTVGLADELAAAAGLLMGQAAEASPLVVIKGLAIPEGDGRAGDLVRPRDKDLYL